MTFKPTKRFRKTKVIATIGPACDDAPTIRAMIDAGMNVARLNMSHGDEDRHAQTLARIRAAAEEARATVAVMVDTRGREIRTGPVAGGAVVLERGRAFYLHGRATRDGRPGVSLSYAKLHEHVKPGHRILIDDGLIELSVAGVDGDSVETRVECGGTLRENKGVNLPDTTSVLDDIADDNSRELRFAAAHGIEYLAASFIRNGDEVREIRRRLRALDADIPIIAKIENREGVENIEEIVSKANGVMVARGDLGAELAMGQGPTIQKRIIRATVSNGKPVITATQMLDSMERNPRPTRAEVSDVANAIFDGTSAVMLSGETATGARPVEAVRTMVSLALEAEAGLREYGYLQQIKPHPSNEVTEAVAQASIAMASHLRASAIVALTETGFTSRLISKHRPECPIFAVTSSRIVVRRLAMNWGVQALLSDVGGSDNDKVKFAIDEAKKAGYAKPGDLVVVTAGSSHQAGSTNMIRVVGVPDNGH